MSSKESKTMAETIRRGAGALVVAGACCGLTACGAAPAAGKASDMKVSTAEQRGSMKGSADVFTGEVSVSMLFGPEGARDFGCASVTFQPGARSAWHSHPAGQTLVVTEGVGWVQAEGQPRQTIRPGDVIWTPPGVRHWHGATSREAMTHLALQGAVDGQVVDWGEHVADADYDPPETPKGADDE